MHFHVILITITLPKEAARHDKCNQACLEESLKHLLLKKPLDKITINDLTTDCGISRMTFYYHFKDIYDLVEWCCLEDARIALQGKKNLFHMA